MSLLKKWPRTEMEYWMAIEALGGFIWRSRHEHFHGRIDKLPDGLSEAQETIEKVAAEAAERFNLVPMQECETRAPEPSHHDDGREFYWAWYDRMKDVEAHEAHAPRSAPRVLSAAVRPVTDRSSSASPTRVSPRCWRAPGSAS